MVILGLGTNEGDRLAYLRQALRLLEKISDFNVCQISPVYQSDALLPENAPLGWNKPYLNVALRCDTRLSPQALLQQLQAIEIKLGRPRTREVWQPRVIDIDILAWDDQVIQNEELMIPHQRLLDRPFALWPLADVAPLWMHPVAGKTAMELVEPWGSRFSGQALLHTRQIPQRLETPQLIGIINVTPDSFSDGGLCFNAENACKEAINAVAAGAEIIDIGAESTAPQAQPVDAHSEWQRLRPVLEAIKASLNQFAILPKISVDTRHAEVATKALQLGVDWINDVTGLSQHNMRALAKESQAQFVVMHHLSIPPSREKVIPLNKDPVLWLYQWAEKYLDELAAEGISREKLIFDVGIGFGKIAEQSLLLLKNISVFHALNTRLLIGHSRKSFLKLFTEESPAKRDIETVAASLYLADKKVDYLRIHQVEMCARAFKVQAALSDDAIPPRAYEKNQK